MTLSIASVRARFSLLNKIPERPALARFVSVGSGQPNVPALQRESNQARLGDYRRLMNERKRARSLRRALVRNGDWSNGWHIPAKHRKHA